MNAIYLAEREKNSCDSSRSKKQWDCVIKWLENLYKGTIVACTGFGKTRIAMHIIRLLKRNKPERSVVIVVPSHQLKQQWEKGLKKLSLDNNVHVWIVNTLINQSKIECDLLILDEVHRIPAPTFSKTFKVVSYKFILGLTATLRRSDGKHKVIEKKAPVLERIPLREARKNGWVSNYRHYNLYVEMSEDTKLNYVNKTKLFGKAMDKFGRDFNYMKDCTNLKPYKREGRWQPPPVVELAKSLGWRGNHIGSAFDNIRYNKTAPRGQKRSIWGNDEHTYSPKRLNTWAIIGMQAIRDIKSLIYNSPEKVEAGIELLSKLKKRTITFSQITETADKIKEALPRETVVYHSDIQPEIRITLVEKEYKTKKGLEKFFSKKESKEWTKKEKYGKFYAQKYENKKIPASKIKEEAIHKILNTKTVRIIATGKALNEGFDAPEISMAVIFSRTTSDLDETQRIGRAVRTHTFDDGQEKESIIVDIILKNTKDEIWAGKSQNGLIGIIHVNSIEELLQKEAAFGQKAIG